VAKKASKKTKARTPTSRSARSAKRPARGAKSGATRQAGAKGINLKDLKTHLARARVRAAADRDFAAAAEGKDPATALMDAIDAFCDSGECGSSMIIPPPPPEL
jgi:hypothetical protein